MTIRALKEKLSQYDNDAEVTFEVDGVFEPTSITITKQYCEAHIHNGLRVEDITKRNNNCLIVLARAEKGYLPTLNEVLEQESKTDDDCISREAAINCVTATSMCDPIITQKRIKRLPSVQPKTKLEPKTRHWIIARTFPTKIYDEYLVEYECSECGRRIRCTESQLVNYPYCHCGAKMKSEGKE